MSKIDHPTPTATMQTKGTASLVISRADEGAWFKAIPGERIKIRVPSAAVGGRYAILESVVEPGFGPPLHTHREDEIFEIIEGTMTFQAGSERFEAEPGHHRHSRRRPPCMGQFRQVASTHAGDILARRHRGVIHPDRRLAAGKVSRSRHQLRIDDRRAAAGTVITRHQGAICGPMVIGASAWLKRSLSPTWCNRPARWHRPPPPQEPEGVPCS